MRRVELRGLGLPAHVKARIVKSLHSVGLYAMSLWSGSWRHTEKWYDQDSNVCPSSLGQRSRTS
eukprot:6006511-Amphidinium_carterae.1